SIPLPFSPVPITGQTLAVGLVATILPWRQSVLSVFIYLLLGGVGIPVYSQFSGGLGILFGPTGGYLFSFVITALFISLYLKMTKLTLTHAAISNVIGCFLTLIIGTLWLKVALGLSWSAAFVAGFTPFVLLGIVKALISAWLGIEIHKRLKSAKLL
ncbi:MAG: BioY family transporter, partial [Bacillales bacterium]|nr:BioY family transporter [Bacillales bacterium]